MPARWEPHDWRRQIIFWRATITRVARTLREAATEATPPGQRQTRMWFNGFAQTQMSSVEHWNDMDAALRYSDVGFIEFGGLFEWSWLSGAEAPSFGTINGCQISPLRPGAWESTSLGAIQYQYFSGNGETGLPDTHGTFGQHQQFDPVSIGDFYERIEDVNKLGLLEAKPLQLPVCLLYSEAARYRYMWFDRSSLVQGLHELFDGLLEKTSLTARFISAININEHTLEGC